jgi:ribulose-bisphosphate carboxylase small chain
MRVTQGTFSFLPDLSDDEIAVQLRYALRNGWAIMLEHTDDPHPRNILWEMWDKPRFDLRETDAGVVLDDLEACRAAFPDRYVKVVCYDRSLGRQTTRLAFIVQRPADEPRFRLERRHGADRRLGYALGR